jgi:hypothetical protein
MVTVTVVMPDVIAGVGDLRLVTNNRRREALQHQGM